MLGAFSIAKGLCWRSKPFAYKFSRFTAVAGQGALFFGAWFLVKLPE
jgi:hypothetical protein